MWTSRLAVIPALNQGYKGKVRRRTWEQGDESETQKCRKDIGKPKKGARCDLPGKKEPTRSSWTWSTRCVLGNPSTSPCSGLAGFCRGEGLCQWWLWERVVCSLSVTRLCCPFPDALPKDSGHHRPKGNWTSKHFPVSRGIYLHCPLPRLPRDFNKGAILARNWKWEETMPWKHAACSPTKSLHSFQRIYTYLFETSRAWATASCVLPCQHERCAAIGLFSSVWSSPSPRGLAQSRSLPQHLWRVFLQFSFLTHLLWLPEWANTPALRQGVLASRTWPLEGAREQQGPTVSPERAETPGTPFFRQENLRLHSICPSTETNISPSSYSSLANSYFSSLSSLSGKQNN